ncbi:hypothetical protein KPH14_004637 [Odynerus spinipes]|uniref:Uncharacterized protein n=1 Tax=Odynerus spinipes TaxID=1348599 RepID=A0AAD9RMB5_9HYME|nr:hypothetical protein KPH14_004637 [Odynerus spinipes]
MAGIGSEGMSLYWFNNGTYQYIKSYPQYSGMRIIVDNFMYSTVAIIQNFNESIVILKFNYDQSTHHTTLSFVQTLEVSSITDIHTWHYMNQLYLGIASHYNISICAWFGEHFDVVQVLNFGAEKLMFFQNKGFMNLICITSRTVMLRYFFQFSKFMIVQTLPASNAIVTFDINKDHLQEHFICLSTYKHTVVYKEVHGHFVPFQEISATEKVIPIISNNAIVLLLLDKNMITIYQYDGWKFLELNVKMSDINDVYLVKVDVNELIILRHGSTTLKVVQPRWGEKKSLHNLQDEIRSWCLKAKTIAQRLPKSAQILETPLHITNGYIHEISTQNINGDNAKKVQKLTKQYKYFAIQLETMNDSFSQKIYNNNSQFKTIHAKKVQIKCKSLCKINNMIIKEKDNPLLKLRSTRSFNQNLTFKNLKTRNITNFKCPTPAFIPQNFYPKKLINNISLSDLQEKTLKISNDQVVTGDHIFVELDVVHSVMPLDIATNFTTQTIHAKEIRVKELNLKNNGFLLPLNGPPSKISGCLTASKVKVKGYIDLKGGLKGEGARSLMPVKQVPGFIEINGNRSFHNVKIANILKTKDIYRQKGKSLKYILDNGVPLSTRNLPMHLIFSSNNVEWKNVTIKNYNNWITAHSNDKVLITGKKQTTHNVTLTHPSHTKLTIPKLNFPLCGSTANISNIQLSQVLIENMTVQNLNSFHIFGAQKLNSTIFETSLSIDTIDLSKKNFIGVINVDDILPFDIKGLNLNGFQEITNVWKKANVFKNVKNATHLKANTLQASKRINLPLPTTVRNVISKGNTYVGTINGVDINDFIKNVVRVDDTISLNNITFSNRFTSNNVQFLYGPLNLTYTGIYSNLHSKHILGKLKTEKLNILKPIIHKVYNASTNYVIQGNVTFTSEPAISNVNSFNLNQLSLESYTIDENIIVSGNNFSIRNMTVMRNNITKASLNIPHYGTWSNMSHSLLSKTKPQEISVPCWFNDIKVSNIKGSKNLTVKSSVPYIKDIIEMSLKKNESQVIRGKWHFEELVLPGYVNLKGRVNNMDLRTDVVKHNTKKNIITGKKTILELATKNLYGLNFSEWSQNAVLLSEKELIVIKGEKVFHDINIQDLSLTGTIMGKKIENALLKSKPQIITGAKNLNGSIKMPSLLLDGLVNDVNLISFTKHLLKRNKSEQRLMTNITLEDNLEILGNIFIEDLYNGIRINNLNREYKKMESVEKDLDQVAKVVKVAETALNNRAFYVNKLKIYKNITSMTSSINKSYPSNYINPQCELQNGSLFCNNTEMKGFGLGSNIRNYTTIQVLSLKENMFIILITADCVSVHAGNIANATVYQAKAFCVPNILQASAELSGNSMWIILQLPSKMLALHYLQWDNIKQYILPPSDILITSTPPDKELLMFRSDGVWSLGELGRPRHIVKEPLTGKIEIFSYGTEYYIKNIKNNDTIFMRPSYVGN